MSTEKIEFEKIEFETMADGSGGYYYNPNWEMPNPVGYSNVENYAKGLALYLGQCRTQALARITKESLTRESSAELASKLIDIASLNRPKLDSMAKQEFQNPIPWLEAEQSLYQIKLPIFEQNALQPEQKQALEEKVLNDYFIALTQKINYRKNIRETLIALQKGGLSPLDWSNDYLTFEEKLHKEFNSEAEQLLQKYSQKVTENPKTEASISKEEEKKEAPVFVSSKIEPETPQSTSPSSSSEPEKDVVITTLASNSSASPSRPSAPLSVKDDQFFDTLRVNPSFEQLIGRIGAIESRKEKDFGQSLIKNNEKKTVLKEIESRVKGKTHSVAGVYQYIIDNRSIIEQSTRKETGFSSFFPMGSVDSIPLLKTVLDTFETNYPELKTEELAPKNEL